MTDPGSDGSEIASRYMFAHQNSTVNDAPFMDDPSKVE